MKKAVLYARVSSKDQEKEGFSIPAQQRLLKEYAQKNSIEVVAEFIEIESAKKAGRTKFNEMIKFLKKNKSVKALLVEKTDRLYRNFNDYVVIEDYQIEVHLVKENSILSEQSRSQDKFMHGIKVLVAKNYIDNLKEETQKGMLEKANQGIYPSRAPIGYLNITGDNNKKIIGIDFKTAPYIKRMFELYSSGNYSLNTLRQKLFEEGFTYGKQNKMLPKSIAEFILKNEFYTGIFQWKGRRFENAQHDPIISKQLFYKVQERLRDPRKSKCRKGEFAYTNMIKCGGCGCYLTAEIKKEKYVYYHCTGNRGKCGQKWLREEIIENTFSDLLFNIQLKDEDKKALIEALKVLHEQKTAYHNMSVSQIEKKIKKLQGRIDNAYIDKLDRVISEDFWKSNTKVWQEEKDNLIIKLEALQRTDKEYFENVSLILELAKQAHSSFLRQNLDRKRKLLNLVCSNFSYKGGKLVIELNQPFQLILEANKQQSGEIIDISRDTAYKTVSLDKKWLPG